MMIASLYSSSLVSHLTYPQFQPMMRTVEDLVKAGFYWGAPYNPTTDQIFNLNVRLSILGLHLLTVECNTNKFSAM